MNWPFPGQSAEQAFCCHRTARDDQSGSPSSEGSFDVKSLEYEDDSENSIYKWSRSIPNVIRWVEAEQFLTRHMAPCFDVKS